MSVICYGLVCLDRKLYRAMCVVGFFTLSGATASCGERQVQEELPQLKLVL